MNTLYSPGDVAEQLGIQSSTLRKYADVLEKRVIPSLRMNVVIGSIERVM